VIELYIFSFVAGVLTVLAPCILPLLPVIIGGSALHPDSKPGMSLRRPLTIIASLVVSIVLFTLLLKATTALLGIPSMVWSIIAGGIVLFFGISLLFPQLWEMFMDKTRLALLANRLMGRSQESSGTKKDILLGAALGPVFNSCSPTYALIVATVLPVSFLTGLGYLFAYSLGLGLILLLVSIFGRAVVQKFKWASNPHGTFQKTIGVLFIIVGLSVMFGIDKQIQTYALDQGWYDPIMKIEQSFMSK
jgi:cytochrome c biogenesis protein CcdA